jgi:hypothetical protein
MEPGTSGSVARNSDHNDFSFDKYRVRTTWYSNVPLNAFVLYNERRSKFKVLVTVNVKITNLGL